MDTIELTKSQRRFISWVLHSDEFEKAYQDIDVVLYASFSKWEWKREGIFDTENGKTTFISFKTQLEDLLKYGSISPAVRNILNDILKKRKIYHIVDDDTRICVIDVPFKYKKI